MARGATATGTTRNALARHFLPRALSLSSRKVEKLRALEVAANRAPGDAYKQFQFVRELGRSHPELVVQRAKDPRYAMSDAIHGELLKAQASLGQFSTPGAGAGFGAGASGQQLGSIFDAAAAPAAASSASSMAKGITPREPVYVSMVEASFKTQVWRTVRTMIGLFLLVSAVGVVMDERGALGGKGGLGNSNTVEPVTSDKTFADICGVEEALGELRDDCQDKGALTRWLTDYLKKEDAKLRTIVIFA